MFFVGCWHWVCWSSIRGLLMVVDGRRCGGGGCTSRGGALTEYLRWPPLRSGCLMHRSGLGCKFRRNSGGIPHYSGIFTNLDRNLITVHGGFL